MSKRHRGNQLFPSFRRGESWLPRRPPVFEGGAHRHGYSGVSVWIIAHWLNVFSYMSEKLYFCGQLSDKEEDNEEVLLDMDVDVEFFNNEFRTV